MGVDSGLDLHGTVRFYGTAAMAMHLANLHTTQHVYANYICRSLFRAWDTGTSSRFTYLTNSRWLSLAKVHDLKPNPELNNDTLCYSDYSGKNNLNHELLPTDTNVLTTMLCSDAEIICYGHIFLGAYQAM